MVVGRPEPVDEALELVEPAPMALVALRHVLPHLEYHEQEVLRYLQALAFEGRVILDLDEDAALLCRLEVP